MIVGSQEWSEVQPIDWRQITSLSLSLFVPPFVSLPLSHPFSPSFELIWCNGNTSKRSLPCRTIGCTLSTGYADACLQRVGTNTNGPTHTDNVHSKTKDSSASAGAASDEKDHVTHERYPLTDPLLLKNSICITERTNKHQKDSQIEKLRYTYKISHYTF